MDINSTLAPMTSASSFPGSPSSGTRKRSIHEVDDVAGPSLNAKRSLTEFTGENQENRDPSLSSQPDDTSSPPVDSKHTLPPPPTVEIPMRNTPSKAMSGLDSAGNGTSPSTNAASNPEPDTPASKKRKLASAGNDPKQQEKEAKERQKAEEKARKEEEKAKKEEERAKREEEKRLRAEEKKKRDAEREEEKRLREEEKRKKEAQREEERKQRDEKKKAKEDEKAAKEEEKRKKDEEKEKKTRVSGIHNNLSRDGCVLIKPVTNEIELFLRQTTGTFCFIWSGGCHFFAQEANYYS
jgi:chromatin assembly factor 1 subunit A